MAGQVFTKPLWVAAFILGLGLGGFFMLRTAPPKQPDDTPSRDLATEPTLAEHLAKDASTLQSQNETLLSQAERVLHESSSAPSAVVPDIPAKPAWQAAPDIQPSMPLPDAVSIYMPVAIDMDNPAFPAPGERVALTMPGGENLAVNVESARQNPNGDYSWSGHLDGQGTDYPVVMTYGARSVFATVTTEQGSYTLESIDGSGWLYKNPSEFELSRPGAKDYLEIPARGAGD